jgi:hypothetical protein
VNAAIEFHDSTVIAVETNDAAVVVRLDAYIHRAVGRPGFDAGTGWSQIVEMIFKVGIVEERPDALPCTLDDGSVSGAETFDGLISLPESVDSAVRFEAHGLYGERLVIRGQGLTVIATGEPQYVEAFPGSQ